MIFITKIIYMRLFQDHLANKIFAETITNHTDYILGVLKHGIEVGRIDSGFDLRGFADILIGAMEVRGIRSFAGTINVEDRLDQGKPVLVLLARLLKTALK
jgi:hypothetical protein